MIGLISKQPISAENSGQTYSDTESQMPCLSLLSPDASLSYQKIELGTQEAELRANFDEFQKAVADYESYAENFLQGMKKHLHFKIQKAATPHEMLDYFEPILFKYTKNPKQVRKNWSEAETLLLINMIIYYCLWKEEEPQSLVMILH